MTPSLLSINLLEQLSELKRNILLNSQKEETHRARYTGRHAEPHALSRHTTPLPQTSMCSLTQKLSEPCPFVFLWRLHHIGMVD